MQIPWEFAQTLMPQGDLKPQQIQANPQDFGGQVGQVLEQHAVQRQQIVNAANVDDVYANQFDPQFRKKYMDFLCLKGKDAEQAFPQVQQEMHDLLTQTADDLPNEQQRHTFHEVARRRMKSDLDAMARHAAAETDSWINQTTDASAGIYAQRMVDKRNDPSAVQGYVNNIVDTYTARGQATGQSEATYKLQAANVINQGIAKAVQADLDRQDPESAQNTFNHYSQYLSDDGVKASIQSQITPTLEAHHVNAVTTDLYTKFNPNDPNVDPNAAAAFVRDPKNYPKIGDAQRTSVLNNFFGDGNRAALVQREKQGAADNAFTDAINKGQLSNQSQFNAWTDPTIGLAASAKLVQSAIERSLKPGAQNSVENRQTYLDLSDGIQNRQVTDPSPINDAYLKGEITDESRKELLNLLNLTAHSEKTEWFEQAQNMYQTRYSGKDPVAQQMYPQFINQLKQAVINQKLHGQQIVNVAKEMLDPVDMAVIAHHMFGEDTTEAQPGLGGFAVPNMNAVSSNAPAQPGILPPRPGQAAPSMEPEAESWVKKSLTSAGHQVTDANVKTAYDQLKSQDPQFYKHWKVGD